MSRTSFLDLAAKTLYQKYGENISRCCLVFPGRRAGLFFQKELTKYLEREIWMPPSTGISQLVEKVAGQKATDPIILLAELFLLFKELTGKEEGLQDFYSLGNLLLHDFDQADKYLLDANDLFHNVRDLKRIAQDFSFLSAEQQKVLQSFWSSFRVNPDHQLNRSFISVWEILPVLYRKFNEILLQKGYAYEGMIYRKMVSEIGQGAKSDFLEQYQKFFFIGFNALNACEKKLFRYLRDQKKAGFFWDYDPYYIENPIQEAGLFLRENMKEFPPENTCDKTTSPLQDKRMIRILAVPSFVMQAKIVPGILRDHKLPFDTRTAVVLADENLLLPLLYGLGQQNENKGNMNVTMGFPLRQTSLFALFDSLMHYYNKSGGKHDFGAVAMHPYVRALDLAQDLRTVPENEEGLYTRLTYILDRIDRSPELLASDVMLTAVERETRKLLNTLYRSVCASGVDISVTVFTRLVRQHLSQARIPFSGEPLEGLQIMGFLETRCLDFENLIIVSSQENVLPKAYRENSFIPYNIRKAFGLPSSEHHIAVQAYYFYRLLQRADNVFFIWNSNTEGPARGEISRFIRQIEFELPGSSIVKTPVTYVPELPGIAPVQIPKTDSVKDILQEFTDSGEKRFLSPTALATYVRCPLKFYYKYIRSVEEPPDLSDSQDHMHFGNIVHAVLERLYKPLTGKTISKDEILDLIRPRETFRKLVSGVAEEYLQKITGEKNLPDEGKWLLFSEVASQYTERFVKFDASRAPLKICAVEKRFNGRYKQVMISGITDRVDLLNGQMYIIDYKTGVKKNAFSKTEDLFDTRLSLKNGDTFQILCYVFLHREDPGTTQLPLPLLFYLNSLFHDKGTGHISYDKKALDDPQVLETVKEEFLFRLDRLLEELFNFNIPFIQTEFTDNCIQCPFITICQREKHND